MSHPVYLNVFDNSSFAFTHLLRFLGLGLYLSSVQVHGMEHIFWPNFDEREDGSSIVSGNLHQIECLRGRTLLHSIHVGDTQLDSDQVLDIKQALQNTYTTNSYHPITNNCHHFSDNFCRDLTNNLIPRWINRITSIGRCCSCLTAAAWGTNKCRHIQVLLPKPGASGSHHGDHDDGGGDAGGHDLCIHVDSPHHDGATLMDCGLFDLLWNFLDFHHYIKHFHHPHQE